MVAPAPPVPPPGVAPPSAPPAPEVPAVPPTWKASKAKIDVKALVRQDAQLGRHPLFVEEVGGNNHTRCLQLYHRIQYGADQSQTLAKTPNTLNTLNTLNTTLDLI